MICPEVTLDNNNVLFYVLFLQIGAHSPLQSKAPTKNKVKVNFLERARARTYTVNRIACRSEISNVIGKTILSKEQTNCLTCLGSEFQRAAKLIKVFINANEATQPMPAPGKRTVAGVFHRPAGQHAYTNIISKSRVSQAVLGSKMAPVATKQLALKAQSLQSRHFVRG